MTRLRGGRQPRIPAWSSACFRAWGAPGPSRPWPTAPSTWRVIGRPLRDTERALGLVGCEAGPHALRLRRRPRVQATALTTGDLVAIYLGTRVTWPDGQRLRLVLRPATDADTEILRAFSPEVSAAVEAAAPPPRHARRRHQQRVQRDPGRIARRRRPHLASPDPREARPLRALSWNGVEPTLENLESGRYPLEKSIHVVFRTPPAEGVRRFVAFLASPRGRALLRELGALPVDFPPVE